MVALLKLAVTFEMCTTNVTFLSCKWPLLVCQIVPRLPQDMLNLKSQMDPTDDMTIEQTLMRTIKSTGPYTGSRYDRQGFDKMHSWNALPF
ncbi:hypothetical protein PR048_031504 [Dryococelus australis]|uniref:Uncharacterized protein n=1 Tax=Dryococelus australis TaxID=614101 RepID=A0ABQ9G854_9NEOP|nr:hypothetical protein PR048_031504 [Dryococelus australis]